MEENITSCSWTHETQTLWLKTIYGAQRGEMDRQPEILDRIVAEQRKSGSFEGQWKSWLGGWVSEFSSMSLNGKVDSKVWLNSLSNGRGINRFRISEHVLPGNHRYSKSWFGCSSRFWKLPRDDTASPDGFMETLPISILLSTWL
jgi:hypothetical protein